MRSVRVMSARLLCRRKKDRDQHQTGAVRRGHQERPQSEIAEADAHAYPPWVPRANQSIEPEGYKCQRRQPAKRFVANAGVQERNERNNQPD